MANMKESPSFNSLGDHSDSPATSLLKVPQANLSTQPSFEDLAHACSAMTTEDDEDKVEGDELSDKATNDHILEHEDEERREILRRSSNGLANDATKQRKRGSSDSKLLDVLYSSSGRLKQRVDKTTGMFFTSYLLQQLLL